MATARVTPQRYYTCSECGHALNVTALFSGRKYRCAFCGNIFHHLPERTTAEPKPAQRPPSASTRLTIAAIVTGVGVYSVGAYSGLKGDKQWLAIVALCAAVAGAWGIALVRRTSRDSAAFGGITITTIGLGVFVSCFVVGDLPEASLPPVMFAMLIWLGLGGMLLARFARNLSLMRVNEQGIVIEIPQGGKMPKI